MFSGCYWETQILESELFNSGQGSGRKVLLDHGERSSSTMVFSPTGRAGLGELPPPGGHLAVLTPRGTDGKAGY